jgi:molybdopterin-guanine dinucleotide biosynthesis protein A
LIELPGGKTILERLVGEIRATGIEDIILCAKDRSPYAMLGLDAVPDRLSGKGPLGGIDAALAHYSDRKKAVLFLPCDLPGITTGEIRTLLTAFADTRQSIIYALTSDGIEHPLCAVVAIDERESVKTAINSNELGVRRLWQALDAKQITFANAAAFANINTPEDLEQYVLRTAGTVPRASTDVGRVSHPAPSVSDAGDGVPPDSLE